MTCGIKDRVHNITPFQCKSERGLTLNSNSAFAYVCVCDMSIALFKLKIQELFQDIFNCFGSTCVYINIAILVPCLAAATL